MNTKTKTSTKTKKEAKLKSRNLKAATAEIKKEPAAERPTMYVYADGMTQDEKKKFRRTFRAKIAQLTAKIEKAATKKEAKAFEQEIKNYKAECYNPDYKA